MKCYYHKIDLDGFCSGAIVKYKYPGCEMCPIDYGDPFPWEEIKNGETVFMVDFTLEPFVDMIRLNKMCDLVWIDHHKSHISEEKKYFKKGDTRIEGIREDGTAACELTWEYLLSPKVSRGVHLLGRYDVWDHKDPNVLPFQYGLRLRDTNPTNQVLWKEVFFSTEFIDAVLEQGRVVLKYVEQENIKYAAFNAFETTLDGFSCIAINRLLTNSKLFDSVWNPEKYDLMIAFGFARDKWRVSLYTTKEDVDVSVIAVAHGGGGHKQSGGFTCLELPLTNVMFIENKVTAEIPLFMIDDEVFDSDKNYGVVTKIERDDEIEAEKYRYLVSFPNGDLSFYWGFQLEGK